MSDASHKSAIPLLAYYLTTYTITNTILGVRANFSVNYPIPVIIRVLGKSVFDPCYISVISKIRVIKNRVIDNEVEEYLFFPNSPFGMT